MLGRQSIFLAFSVMATSTSLLLFSRGQFIITALAAIFVYVRRRGFSRWFLIGLAAIGATVLWGFGILGDLRSHGASGESIILNLGGASDHFLNSNIPGELFWPYIYISSPLANLQLNVTGRVATDVPALYFALEFLPDFVSKRIVSEEAVSSISLILITPQLTVTTMYGLAFVLMGWLGMLLSFAYFIVISLSCLTILKGSRYLISTSSILSSLAFLGIFDNMYLFAGGITQVLVALSLHLFERRARQI